MTPLPAGSGTPGTGKPMALHRRTIEYEAFEAGEQGESMTIVGRLRDTRPWASDDDRTPELVHDMELRVTVSVGDLTIVDAEASMHTFPHVECPAIVEAFRSLVGLSVGRGYTKEVQRRFGGPRGCAHLEQLARSLGPVVMQAAGSFRLISSSDGPSEVFTEGVNPWARNTCHVWAEGGAAEEKLAAGWQPGLGPYPTPAAVTFRETGR